MKKKPISHIPYRISTLGFTLVELLVVLSIMAMLGAFMIANLAGQRVARNIKIAQNELVTNLRKIQSYTLSSRSLSGNQQVQYYVMKFDLAKPSQYTIEAVYNISTSPLLKDVETINFPTGIRLAFAAPLQITRSSPFSAQTAAYPSGCALVAFATPFAKAYFNNGCSIAAAPSINTTTNPFDDYGRIINFSTNAESYSASTDSLMTITINDQNNTVSKTVTVNGITGLIGFQ